MDLLHKVRKNLNYELRNDKRETKSIIINNDKETQTNKSTRKTLKHIIKLKQNNSTQLLAMTRLRLLPMD